MLMNAADYRESLRSLSPRLFVDGQRIASVADAPSLAPGIAAVGTSYDFAHDPALATLMTARQSAGGPLVNRMLHVNANNQDLLWKLEAVRLLCRESGCAQRYLAHDALNGIFQATARIDADRGTDYHQRFRAYLADVQERDLAIGIAMTDAKGDRSLRPSAQANPDTYVHVVGRRPGGIVISGTKAIVTGAPYMHQFLVMPCRAMQADDAAFAVCCAVPADAPGITIVARPAGRPGEADALFSNRYGQSTGVVLFDNVFVPDEMVFLNGEWMHSGFLTSTYATHHRHSCIGARAGFGDLLIGAGALMIEANGLDPSRHGHIRDAMVELISIVEGFFACGVAASTYGIADPAGSAQPEPIYANVGKLMLATKIYDMQRLAHHVSGGLVVSLPGPDEDHNPETRADLLAVLGGRADVPASHRLAVGRLMEDLTASYQAGWYSIISLHGGGSPEAMKREIWRNYPVADRREFVRQLVDRGLAGPAAVAEGDQPGKCCDTGCEAPPAKVAE